LAEGDSTNSRCLQVDGGVSRIREVWPYKSAASGIRVDCQQYCEGYGKSTKGEYRLFLGHARGSNFEVATQLVIASGLGFAAPAALQNTEALCDEVGKMLVAIMKKLQV
jgi:hypothetical protein